MICFCIWRLTSLIELTQRKSSINELKEYYVKELLSALFVKLNLKLVQNTI